MQPNRLNTYTKHTYTRHVGAALAYQNSKHHDMADFNIVQLMAVDGFADKIS